MERALKSPETTVLPRRAGRVLCSRTDKRSGLNPCHPGRLFAIERRDGKGWKVDTASPKGPWPRVQGLLKAGSAGRCYRFRVPNEQTGGMYRFATHVGLEDSAERVRKTARFRVKQRGMIARALLRAAFPGPPPGG